MLTPRVPDPRAILRAWHEAIVAFRNPAFAAAVPQHPPRTRSLPQPQSSSSNENRVAGGCVGLAVEQNRRRAAGGGKERSRRAGASSPQTPQC